MQIDLLLTIDDLVTALIEHDYYRRYGAYFSDYYGAKRDLLLVLFACNIKQRKLEMDSEGHRRPREQGGQTAFRFMRDERPQDSYEVNGDLTVRFMKTGRTHWAGWEGDRPAQRGPSWPARRQSRPAGQDRVRRGGHRPPHPQQNVAAA